MKSAQALVLPLILTLLRIPSNAFAAGRAVTSFSSRILAQPCRLTDRAAPSIDGDLGDPAWARAARAATFLDTVTGTPTHDQTEALLTYDDQCLYIGFKCHESDPSAIVARETIRNADMSGDDTICLRLDTFRTCKGDDQATFTVNPAGTRAAHFAGGRAGKLEWQGDWQAATRRTSDGWSAELCIPWAVLSYPNSARPITIGINFARYQQHTRTHSLWSDLGPQGFQDREGIWPDVRPPAQAWKPRFSLLPYLEPTGSFDSRSALHAGLDARYQPTPQMTAVGTLAPDFTSVEGAVEGIGFTRTERLAPDRRPFFLEGGDCFAAGDSGAIGNFFNSSRVRAFDTGAKLYGKVSPTTTIGLLDAVAIGNRADHVLLLRHEISPQSNGKLFLAQHLEPGLDNTVMGLTQNLRWGKWQLNGQEGRTFGPDANGFAWTSAVTLNDKNFYSSLRYRWVDPNYRDRLGYIDFRDVQGWSLYNSWSASWKKHKLRSFFADSGVTWDWHTNGQPFRRRASASLGFETSGDYSFGVWTEGGAFEGDRDWTYGASVGGAVSNRLRRWSVDLTSGYQAEKPFFSLGPSINVRLLKKLDVSLGSYIERYQGTNQQHILTFNYQMSPYRAWGGRAVLANGAANGYLSYHNSGRAGLDTYFIIGDPNARTFTKRLLIKWVFAI